MNETIETEVLPLRQWVKVTGVGYYAALRDFTSEKDEKGRGWISLPSNNPWEQLWVRAKQDKKAKAINVGGEVFTEEEKQRENERRLERDETEARQRLEELAEELRAAGYEVTGGPGNTTDGHAA
jgi:hypothetical protein